MLRRLPLWLILSAAFVLLLVVLGRQAESTFSEAYDRYVVFPNSNVALQPVDELVSGRVIEQPVPWQFAEAVDSRDLESTVCVRILMGNYRDRSNQGWLGLDLIYGEERQRALTRACSVEDHQDHRFCFPDVQYRDIHDQPTTIRLVGIDGQWGSSVTAFTTGHTIYGSALIDGYPATRSLRFSVSTRREDSFKPVRAWGVMGLALLPGLVLIAGFTRSAGPASSPSA